MNVRDLLDSKCSPTANLAYLTCVFEGYRARMLGNTEDSNPHSLNSASSDSWLEGWNIAQKEAKQ